VAAPTTLTAVLEAFDCEVATDDGAHADSAMRMRR
jgi:hypothetical protein